MSHCIHSNPADAREANRSAWSRPSGVGRVWPGRLRGRRSFARRQRSGRKGRARRSESAAATPRPAVRRAGRGTTTPQHFDQHAYPHVGHRAVAARTKAAERLGLDRLVASSAGRAGARALAQNARFNVDGSAQQRHASRDRSRTNERDDHPGRVRAGRSNDGTGSSCPSPTAKRCCRARTVNCSSPRMILRSMWRRGTAYTPPSATWMARSRRRRCSRIRPIMPGARPPAWTRTATFTSCSISPSTLRSLPRFLDTRSTRQQPGNGPVRRFAVKKACGHGSTAGAPCTRAGRLRTKRAFASTAWPGARPGFGRYRALGRHDPDRANLRPR